MFRVIQDFIPETMEVTVQLTPVVESKDFNESFKAGFSKDIKFVDGKIFITLIPTTVFHGKK
jgi:hypothetical protein